MSSTPAAKKTQKLFSSSNSKQKKQGNLFSFFSKKVTQKKTQAASPVVAPAVPKAAQSSGDSSSRDVTKSKNVSADEKAKAELVVQTETNENRSFVLIKRVCVNCSIAVFWPDDGE